MPCNGEFLLSGTAVQQGNCIQLTASAQDQQGCSWLNTPIDFSQPFTHNMSASFGTVDGSGADGICLIYQTGGPSICGISGGGMGAQGIANSFIIEFDTWDNDALQSDIAADHSAISINGDLNDQIDGPVALPNLEDGSNHNITFSWDPIGDQYTVSLDGNVILSGSFDIINQCFGGSNLAYWGYTASTGSAFNTQSVCPTLPPAITADAGIDVVIPCASAQLTLDGTGTAVGNYTYSWSSPTGGTIVSGSNTLTPTVMGAGTYILTLTDLNGGCQETDEIVVSLNSLQANINAPFFAPCAGGEVTLDGSSSTSGGFITYQWSTPDGQLLSAANQPTVQAGAPGTYTLTITYSDGQIVCTDQASIVLQPNTNIPVVNATGGNITCNSPVVTLNGLGPYIGPQFSYQWATNDGIIVSGDQTLTPVVGAPGLYSLTVVNSMTNCMSMATVEIGEETDPPLSVASALGELGCNASQIMLTGAGSDTGPNIEYSWQTNNGNIVAGANTLTPTVDAPGDYFLLVSNETTGCFGIAEVTVGEGPPGPSVQIAPTDTLNCAIDAVLLDGSPSGASPDYTYSWTTNNGSLLGTQDTIVAAAGAPATYYLAVTDTATLCTSIDSVIVTEQISSPDADAGPDQSLDCGISSVILDGTGSSLLPSYIPQWSSAVGSILSGGQSLAPTVSGPGTFVLIITDTLTQCTGTDTVLLINAGNIPSVSIAMPDTLDCATPSLDLIGSGAAANGNGFTVSWSSAEGHPISNADQLTATVTAPGTYTLEILDTLNNCSANASVTVEQDTIPPVAAIADTDTLTCARTTLLLNGTASSAGSNFELQWTTNDGNFTTESETLMPVINQPGTYELAILNTQNQCTAVAVATVAQDTVAPVISLLPAPAITCASPTVLLSAVGTDSGPLFGYEWASPDGLILNGAQTLQPEVAAGGTYTLQTGNLQNGCISSASIAVLVDTLAPVADAGPDTILNCYQPALTLGGNNTSIGNRYLYAWSSGSAIPSNTSEPTVTTDTAGAYQLTVLDTLNGCQAMDTLLLAEDFEEPTAILAMPDTLNCLDSLVLLDGSASSSNGNYIYRWTALNSAVAFTSSTPMVEVTAAGPYRLEVENLDNGCTALDTAEVFQDTNLPLAAIEPADTLNCTQGTVSLNAVVSSPSNNLQLDWSTTGGSFVSGTNGLQPEVNAPGVYALRVTDLSNNCQTNANITVAIDTISPGLSLGDAPVLNCRDTVALLTGSSPSTGVTWDWITTDGHLLADANSPAPLIDQPGTYQATVVNLANGCTSTAQQTILQDIALPNVEIAAPPALTCIQNTVLLDGSSSDPPPGSSIAWQAPDGSIISDTLQTAVQIPGQYTLAITNAENFCRNSADIMVAQDTVQPTVSLALADTLDCATPSVNLISSVNAAGPASYEWTTMDGQVLSGADSLNASTEVPGVYRFTATDLSNGCQASDSLTVAQDTVAPVIAPLVPPTLTCTQPVAWLNASAGSNTELDYQWAVANGGQLSSPADSSAVQVGAAGLYSVAVTSLINACTASSSYTVNIDTIAPDVVIALPDTLNCAVSSVPLDGSNSDAEAGFSLNWNTNNGQISGPTTQADATAAASGTYTLSILNNTNGCTAAQSITVEQDTLSPVAQVASPDTLTCTVATLLLDGTSSSSGAEFAYSWSTNNGLILNNPVSLQPEIAAAGQYALVVTNLQNFCADTTTALVPIDTLAPIAQIAPPAVLTCDQSSVLLSAAGSSAGSGYELVWAGGLLDGTNSLTPTVAQPGSYSLSITDVNNGCTAVANVAVLQDILPPVAEAGSNFIIPCFPELRQLNGSNSSTGPAFSYAWSSADGVLLDGEQTPTPTIESPGTYTLVVTDTTNGCTATDSVLVSQDLPTVAASTMQPDCYGDAGFIHFESAEDGTPPYVYSIDGGSTYQSTPLFQGLSPGSYSLVVQDINGCEDVLSTLIEQPDSLVVLVSPDTTTINLGEEVAINLQSNYALGDLTTVSWLPNPGLDCYDCLNPVASPRLSTVYQVTATTANGCRDQARIRIAVNKDLPVFIPSAFSPNGDGSNDWFTVYAKPGIISNIHSMQIFNRWGEQVFEHQNFQPNIPAEGWDGFFRNQALNPGVFAYVVEVEFFDGSTELLKGDVTLAR